MIIENATNNTNGIVEICTEGKSKGHIRITFF